MPHGAMALSVVLTLVEAGSGEPDQAPRSAPMSCRAVADGQQR
jgi:hypothetical protein